MENYANVHFQFVSEEDEPVSSIGTVIIRDDEMVLEVPLPGDLPYVIVGKLRNGYYEGVHVGQPGDVPVAAKWVRLAHVWIGTWLEQDIEYLFKFELGASKKIIPS
jgi:hypothetical protein